MNRSKKGSGENSDRPGRRVESDSTTSNPDDVAARRDSDVRARADNRRAGKNEDKDDSLDPPVFSGPTDTGGTVWHEFDFARDRPDDSDGRSSVEVDSSDAAIRLALPGTGNRAPAAASGRGVFASPSRGLASAQDEGRSGAEERPVSPGRSSRSDAAVKTGKSPGAKSGRRPAARPKKPPLTRSQTMARVRSNDTGPELYLRKLLWRRGLRYRVNRRGLPGSPDVWLASSRTAIFVHGCFWHAHDDCPMHRVPKTRVEFWRTKFAKNKERDLRNRFELADTGIKVAIVWGCQIVRMKKDEDYKLAVLDRIEEIVGIPPLKKGDPAPFFDLSLELPANPGGNGEISPRATVPHSEKGAAGGDSDVPAELVPDAPDSGEDFLDDPRSEGE